MKIKNEYVKVKQGKKERTFKNMILNSYLSLYSKGQYLDPVVVDYNNDKYLAECLIKFDTSLRQITPNSLFNKNDFDISINAITYNSEFNSHGVDFTYNYGLRENNSVYDIKEGIFLDDLSTFLGKKITALGFTNGNEIYAVIDTVNYSLYVDDSYEFNVFRKDKFSSDAVCDNNPYHLCPIGKGSIIIDEDYGSAMVFARLYSVGLGRTIGKMEEEYILGEDVEINVEDDYTFSFNFKKGDIESLYPLINNQPKSNQYPVAEYISKYQFPNTNFYISNNKYPLKTDYIYVIYKYRLYYINHGSQVVNLDEFYTMNYYTSRKGLITVKTKIERDDD